MPAPKCPACKTLLAASVTPGVLVCPNCGVRYPAAAALPVAPPPRAALRREAPAVAPAAAPRAVPWKWLALGGAGAVALAAVSVLIVVVALSARRPITPPPAPVARAPADSPSPRTPIDLETKDAAPDPQPEPPKPAPSRPPPHPIAPPDLRPVPAPDPQPAPDATPSDAVGKAVERAVAYLKDQLKNDLAGDNYAQSNRTGVVALVGLALLESGVPADDPAVRKAVAEVRQNAGSNTNTYEISLCLWFLDRLADPKDDGLIRSLAAKLVAGQTPGGLWEYTCQPGFVGGEGDLSLTQFAVLGLWVARKHKAPVDKALQRTAAYCRSSQAAEGSWGYRGDLMRDSMTCAGLMALAVGRGVDAAGGARPDAKDPAVEKALVFLADVFRRGARIASPEAAGVRQDLRGPITAVLAGNVEGLVLPIKDVRALKDAAEKILAGSPGDTEKEELRRLVDLSKQYLASPITRNKETLLEALQPVSAPVQANRFIRPRDPVDFTWDDIYFLWSMERMAVVYGFKTVAGHDWYAWGADLLVAYQREDGSWVNAYSGAVDTSFALLFLRRANVAKDLTVQLQLIGTKDVPPDRVTQSPEKPRNGPEK